MCGELKEAYTSRVKGYPQRRGNSNLADSVGPGSNARGRRRSICPDEQLKECGGELGMIRKSRARHTISHRLEPSVQCHRSAESSAKELPGSWWIFCHQLFVW